MHCRLQRGIWRHRSPWCDLLRLQEEERARRMEYVPERSEVDVDMTLVDPDTREMLKGLDMINLPNTMTILLPLGGGRRR